MLQYDCREKMGHSGDQTRKTEEVALVRRRVFISPNLSQMNRKNAVRNRAAASCAYASPEKHDGRRAQKDGLCDVRERYLRCKCRKCTPHT
uniref:Uncharacterized protein n=1 Tax=Trichuris muris TaxID=70415 RepID=A0A5S6QS07_TRIMR